MFKVRNENKKNFKVNNLNLFESCQKIIGIDGGIVVDNRGLIAFWCSYNKVVKAGYASNPYEKEAIKNWILIS
jgi:hypothetical protein